MTFGYQFARNTKTAMDVYNERAGVCRDFTHLAITLMRAMNIPARYATGYLGDIGVPLSRAPMDFSAWLEVYLGGRWWTVDARHNCRRIGRVLMARGRDAADAALTSAGNSLRLVCSSEFLQMPSVFLRRCQKKMEGLPKMRCQICIG